ncbi:MAG TPA: hypothetical protein VF589_02305, partial [Allosphingosinicella sp.]
MPIDAYQPTDVDDIPPWPRPWPWPPRPPHQPRPPVPPIPPIGALDARDAAETVPLNDANFAVVMADAAKFASLNDENNLTGHKSWHGLGWAILNYILSNFDVSENQQKSLEATDGALIEIVESELAQVALLHSAGRDVTFTALGLNPDNCPGLPLETVMVRSDVSSAGGKVKENRKIVFLRGHLPIKPDKPDKPPKEPRPSPTPGP